MRHPVAEQDSWFNLRFSSFHLKTCDILQHESHFECLLYLLLGVLLRDFIFFFLLFILLHFLDLTKYADLTELLTHLLVKLLISFEQNTLPTNAFYSFSFIFLNS